MEDDRMNPKRRFFQIHLSTAVVLMLVAGVLVWANVRERPGSPVCWVTNGAQESPPTFESKSFGWPYDCNVLRAEYSSTPAYAGFSSTNMLFNVPIALAILLSVCVACEWPIRRHAARKAAE